MATRKSRVSNTLIAAPSLPSSQRLLRAWLRGRSEEMSSGFEMFDFWKSGKQGGGCFTPIPQPRPKARRKAQIWNDEPQITLTLNQQLLLDRARRTKIPCRWCSELVEIADMTEYAVDPGEEDMTLSVVFCPTCGHDEVLGSRPYDQQKNWEENTILWMSLPSLESPA